MKKVIGGKIYNTETADLIASWHNNLARGDFGNCEEDLYVTKKGAYFVHGVGGATSRWAEPVGNNGRAGGSGAIVLSKAEALEWCEQHSVSADTIQEHFEIEEG